MLAAAVINAQTLEEIVKKYSTANKLDQVTNFKTIKITGKMSMMGMELPLEMWMKNPDKIKTVTSINGQDMIQVFDGQKGYSVNPMTGSTTPVEMDAQTLSQTKRGNLFQNYLVTYLKEGKLSLEPDEAVNGTPCFKIKISLDGGNSAYMFVDKAKFLALKTTAEVNNQGMAMTVESFPSDYKDFNGVFLPTKTTTSASGMEFVMEYTNVEVNIPMEDSIFTIKQ